MPKNLAAPPKYRHYRPKDLAVVRIAGGDHYLGKYANPESYERYDRLVAEWLVSRHQPGVSGTSPTSPPVSPVVAVNELILAFWQP